jgi:hypothetical protein
MLMKKINSIPLHRLSQSEHQAFMRFIQQQTARFSPEELQITAEHTKFLEALEALDRALSKNHGSARTKELLALDQKRRKTYSAIRGRLKNTLSSPFETEREAAKQLHYTLLKAGNIQQAEYTDKNVSLNFLCRNLLDEKHLPLCQQLGITHWIEALRDENDTFRKMEIERSTEYALRGTLSNANAREAIDKIYYNMVSRINASVVVELATPNTERFIDLCNKEIKQIKALKAWRRSMRAGKKRREAEKKLSSERLKD